MRMRAPNGRALRNDLLLCGSILLITLLAWGIFCLTRTEGDLVTVTVDGVFYASYPLDEDRRVYIPSYDGSGEGNHLVIREGSASIVAADCPDLICVHHAPIHRVGESIVCLPHRVAVTVEGGQK